MLNAGLLHRAAVFAAGPIFTLGFIFLAAGAASAVTIDMVTVGDVGNSPDTTGYGAVGYEYRIGKYEVTIGQYAEFLNAVAATDTHGLYNPAMATNLNIAGISQSGESGGYTYAVLNNGGNSANRPITYVSWFDAARFANWMHNGQGSGSTETGAYTLNGATSGTVPARNANAAYYIPMESEWYKAAYYSQARNAGTGGYYLYATQSDNAPGNSVGNSFNQANYKDPLYAVTQSSLYSATQNYLTNVGAFTNLSSDGWYGTFDQTGNVKEWATLHGAPSSSAIARGGSWGDEFLGIRSTSRITSTATSESAGIGFRLASPVAVPEPSTYAMALAGLACGGYLVRRCRKRA